LPDTIRKLERRNFTVQQQREIIKSVGLRLPERLRNKLISSFDTNPPFEGIISADGQTHKFKYAPLTSVDVERAFSMHVLSLTRSGLSEKSLRALIVSYFNANDSLDCE